MLFNLKLSCFTNKIHNLFAIRIVLFHLIVNIDLELFDISSKRPLAVFNLSYNRFDLFEDIFRYAKLVGMPAKELMGKGPLPIFPFRPSGRKLSTHPYRRIPAALRESWANIEKVANRRMWVNFIFVSFATLEPYF